MVGVLLGRFGEDALAKDCDSKCCCVGVHVKLYGARDAINNRCSITSVHVPASSRREISSLSPPLLPSLGKSLLCNYPHQWLTVAPSR